MIRTLGVAAALAGAILLAPVAQAKPDSSTGPDRGPNNVVPTTTATPFGSPGTFSDQPGLAIAMVNGNIVTPTGVPLGSATPMAQGNMVVPATRTRPLSGGIRTRHGFTGGMSPLGAFGRLHR